MSIPAARRLAAAITEQRAEQRQTLVSRITTTVATVTPGGSLDGTYAVTVAINSDNVPAPYLAGYSNGHTPTVGDVVAVDLTGGSPLIIGRVIGLPSF